MHNTYVHVSVCVSVHVYDCTWLRVDVYGISNVKSFQPVCKTEEQADALNVIGFETLED